jgi:hypothetical protein
MPKLGEGSQDFVKGDESVYTDTSRRFDYIFKATGRVDFYKKGLPPKGEDYVLYDVENEDGSHSLYKWDVDKEEFIAITDSSMLSEYLLDLEDENLLAGE